MAENYQKKELLAMMNQPENKTCVDCGTPSPQWASVSYGTYFCLECSGAHRGLGVHISFVRSITMDKWSEDQLQKMRLGGNKPFKTFMDTYGPEGGYVKGMGIGEKYKTWAAREYREKLSAEVAGGEFTKSSPPANWNKKPTPSATSTGGRNSPASNYNSNYNGGGGSISRNNSPFTGGAAGENGYGGQGTQKSRNEDFFAGLGSANAGRRDDVPPSQGGKYVGFGSAPPEPTRDGYSSHPSYSLSSHAAPSLQDFQRDPVTALSKGWGLFSSAVGAATATINESVIQPGMKSAGQAVDGFNERGMGGGDRGYGAGTGGTGSQADYAAKLAEQARATTGWLSSLAGEGLTKAQQFAKDRGGPDFSDSLAHLKLGGPSKYQGYEGYGQLQTSEGAREEDDAWGRSWDDDEDQGRGSHAGNGKQGKGGYEDDGWGQMESKPTVGKGAAQGKKEVPSKQDKWDDEWNDF